MSSQRFGSVRANQLISNEFSLTKANITQATSITSGVTCHGNSGIISTINTTLAAGAKTSFAVTNSRVAASSVVLANIVGYSGNAGCPLVRVEGITAGSYSISLTNMFDASTSGSALNGVVKIGYIVM
jgi:hypothetical protein